MNRIARYPECKYCINCDSDNAHRCNCEDCRCQECPMPRCVMIKDTICGVDE